LRTFLYQGLLNLLFVYAIEGDATVDGILDVAEAHRFALAVGGEAILSNTAFHKEVLHVFGTLLREFLVVSVAAAIVAVANDFEVNILVVFHNLSDGVDLAHLVLRHSVLVYIVKDRERQSVEIVLVALIAFDDLAQAVGGTVVGLDDLVAVGVVVLVGFELVDAVDELSLAGLSVAEVVTQTVDFVAHLVEVLLGQQSALSNQVEVGLGRTKVVHPTESYHTGVVVPLVDGVGDVGGDVVNDFDEDARMFQLVAPAETSLHVHADETKFNVVAAERSANASEQVEVTSAVGVVALAQALEAHLEVDTGFAIAVVTLDTVAVVGSNGKGISPFVIETGGLTNEAHRPNGAQFFLEEQVSTDVATITPIENSTVLILPAIDNGTTDRPVAPEAEVRILELVVLLLGVSIASKNHHACKHSNFK